jgi:3-methyladenine DNA glycosylase AlkD
VENFKKAKNEPERQKEIYNFYIANYQRINNWDLVDLTAPDIVGNYLLDKSSSELKTFARSENLWLQRISIIATFSFIRKNRFEPTFEIAKILLNHPHDLIHKATGWMLREVGKRSYEAEQHFLLENNLYKTMPRTMLRYAIEKFDEGIRQDFLKGRI